MQSEFDFIKHDMRASGILVPEEITVYTHGVYSVTEGDTVYISKKNKFDRYMIVKLYDDSWILRGEVMLSQFSYLQGLQPGARRLIVRLFIESDTFSPVGKYSYKTPAIFTS